MTTYAGTESRSIHLEATDMELQRTYNGDLDVDLLQRLLKTLFTDQRDVRYSLLCVDNAGGKWTFDDIQEFYFEYPRRSGRAHLRACADDRTLEVLGDQDRSVVTVTAPDRESIHAVFTEVGKELVVSGKSEPTIVIGHGRDPAWNELKAHLTDQHGLKVKAYETGARAGLTITEVLEDLQDADFALLVMTAEDETKDGNLRPRQNVVHELGLFQGRLGPRRAVVLLENGAEELSNISGLQQLRFSQGNISSTFGDVLATLKREFPS